MKLDDENTSEAISLKNTIKQIGLSLLGLLQGTLGSYLAMLGFVFAFPGTSPDSKDYEEDMMFVPLGYIIMVLWLVVMIATVLSLRKNKANLLLFLISWIVGLIACLIFVFYIH